MGGDFAEEEENLVFGYDAAGERHGAALYAGVSIAAVEVHVVGPVGVRHATAAAELRSRRGVDTRGRKRAREVAVSHILCTNCTKVCRVLWR